MPFLQSHPLLILSIVPILLQLAISASATLPQDIRSFEKRRNISVEIPDAPANQVPIAWPVDSGHKLTFTKYASASRERDYFAALISLQTIVFANYTVASSYWFASDTIDYNAYGVDIEISNFDLQLTYTLVSKMLGAVGAFLQKWEKCQAEWTLYSIDDFSGRGSVISVGSIKKSVIKGGNTVGGENQTGVQTA